MSYLLPHLNTGWDVDQAIVNEDERVVCIRFGHDWDRTCMKMDEVLFSIAEDVKKFAVIYLVDISKIPDFNTMYELYDPCTVMFFYRNKHIMIDMIKIVYKGGKKGRGLVNSPKDYSTKYRY